MRRIIFSLFVWLIPVVPSSQATPDPMYLHTATQAANWILSREVDEKPNAGYWPSQERLPVEEKCDLYYGNAGTLLFLHELDRATGRKQYAVAIERGIRFLDENLPGVRLYGLYEGLAGIAFSLAQFSENPDAPIVCSKAVDILVAGAKRQANGGVRWNDDNDIIGGSAGIGLTLLVLGRQLHRTELISLAVQAGTDLLARSASIPQGRYWLRKIAEEKQYPNFSHGTAGIAYFLLKLYEESGEKRFLDAAIDGANYLNSIASLSPGTRCLLPHEVPEENDLFYLGWCHGPAGTDRFFYELFAVTKDAKWESFANSAAETLLQSGIPEKQTPGYWNNISRCCGAVAVGEFFLARYRLTKAAADRAFAVRIGEYLKNRAETDVAGLKWVQAENRIQPENLLPQTGLMQGAAGVGLFFIHLANVDGVAEMATPLPDSPW